jgi:hypothetical protein
VLPAGAVTSAGPEALELAEHAGLVADPWQAHIVDVSLGEKADGTWAAKTVDVLVSRQNGKNIIVEIRELYGAVMLGEYVVHTAHEFKTTKKSYKRLLNLVYGHPDIKTRLVKDPPLGSPASGYIMEFAGGGMVEFIARSTSSGRGFTEVDLLILDEAQELTDDMIGALVPAMSASSMIGDPQIWYTGSAPGLRAEVWHRRRRLGRSGGTPSMAYFEHSAHPEADLDDREAWAEANPGYQIHISEEFIETTERGVMSDEMFAQERLSISPDVVPGGGVISAELWASGDRPQKQLRGPWAFAFDVSPDHTWSSISIACDVDGQPHIDCAYHQPGTDWLPQRLAAMVADWKPVAVLGDPHGPAGALFPAIAKAGVEVEPVGSLQYGQACGLMFEHLLAGTLRHPEDPVLANAAAAAAKAPMGDAWKWSRRTSTGDITPLVAATLALWGWSQHRPTEPAPGVVNLSDYLDEE